MARYAQEMLTIEDKIRILDKILYCMSVEYDIGRLTFVKLSIKLCNWGKTSTIWKRGDGKVNKHYKVWEGCRIGEDSIHMV